MHQTQNRRRLCLAFRVSYDDLADPTALACDVRHKFLCYQLPTLGDWPPVALLGDDFKGSIPEREPDTWLPRLRKAAGSQSAQS